MKKKAKVIDPPRFPKVINGYENKAKLQGKEIIYKTLVDLTKAMVREVKLNK